MTWSPQSPDLNPIEMVWDELDHRVKEKQPTSAQHMWELLQDCWKSIPGEAGWENAKSVQSCNQGKGWLLWRISNIKYILICWTLFLVTTWFHMYYFIVLMSSPLFYNVENSQNKETIEWVGMSKLLTGTVCVYKYVYVYTVGQNKYLVSHQLCKFSHLKRWERPVIFIIRYTSTMTDKMRKRNPENHIVGFFMNLFANYGGK